MERLHINVIEITGFATVISALHLPYGKGPVYKPRVNCDYGLIASEKEPENPDKNFAYFDYQASVKMTPKEFKLLSKLVMSGDEHAKVIRGINVGVEISAPIWFYRELETYRVGRERLSSESTMHIECKGLSGEELMAKKDEISTSHIQRTVDTISYQTLRRIYFQRRNHRLPIWHQFCHWIETLPFAEYLITV